MAVLLQDSDAASSNCPLESSYIIPLFTCDLPYRSISTKQIDLLNVVEDLLVLQNSDDDCDCS